MAGIYIHIPYCKKACHYCDFHFSVNSSNRAELVAALLKELKIRKDYLEDEIIETIYLGGGTPSILNEAELSSILEQIHKQYSVISDPEITLEANPDDLKEEKVKMLQRSMVNRLSIGIQSFFQEDLDYMNRGHTALESLACIDAVQKSGFDNISIDLIYGYPLLSNDKWKENIDRAINLNIQHLSCYSMTVEPATALDAFIKKGKSAPMNDDQSATQFEYLMSTLASNGINQYEVSNFSKPGFHSRHNSNYWNGSKYLGIGPSAHSFNLLSRESNISDNNQYIIQINSQQSAKKMHELLSPVNRLNELIMTSLRTVKGLDLDQVKILFGVEMEQQLTAQADDYRLKGWMSTDPTKLALTSEGMKFCDLITASLFKN